MFLIFVTSENTKLNPRKLKFFFFLRYVNRKVLYPIIRDMLFLISDVRVSCVGPFPPHYPILNNSDIRLRRRDQTGKSKFSLGNQR